jgi:hypothetical protein
MTSSSVDAESSKVNLAVPIATSTWLTPDNRVRALRTLRTHPSQDMPPMSTVMFLTAMAVRHSASAHVPQKLASARAAVLRPRGHAQQHVRRA